MTKKYVLILLMTALVIVMSGCAAKHFITAQDSLPPVVNVHTIERHVTIYDTVPVSLPQESITHFNIPDTASHLETSVAESDACLTSNGLFCHTLRNKPSLLMPIPHDTVYLIHDSIRTEYIPYPVAVKNGVDKSLSKWQQLRIRIGDTTIGAVLIVLFICLYRKAFF